MTLATTESAETFQTFDNFDEAEVSEETESQEEDDWTGDAEEEESEEGDEEYEPDESLKLIKDSQADSEGKVVKDKDAEKEEEKDLEKKEEEEKEDESKDKDKKDTKKLRIRMGNELFNIDPEATFKVKVDGENQDVTAQELINNFSGKTAWDKKFTEIGKEKKELAFEKQTILKEKEVLNSHVNNVLSSLKDKTKNPADALLYLVEMSGQDPYDVYRRNMESNLEELTTLMDMTEVERELYFHKKKDELHSNVMKKRQVREQQDMAFNQAIQKVDKLRQTFNVSEDEFVEASEELESIYGNSGLDVKSISEEDIVDYASLKTHIVTVKQLLDPYEDNISEKKYGDVVATLSRKLRNGDIDKATLAELIKRNYSVEEEVKELNTKVYSNAKKVTGKKVALKEPQNGFETFDDL